MYMENEKSKVCLMNLKYLSGIKGFLRKQDKVGIPGHVLEY